MMKKRHFLPLLILLLLILCVPAQAGYNPLLVSTYGRGAAVYTESRGGKQAGILYSGFSGELSLSSTNGLYSLSLTPDYTVWVNQKEAQHKEGVPVSSAWLAVVTQENAPLYTSPDAGHITAKHAVGTLVIVWGEFGDYYFVQDYSGMIAGFFQRSCLRKMEDLSYVRTQSPDLGLGNMQEATVYTDGLPLFRCLSATGFSESASYYPIQDGEKVKILSDLGDWVQLADGGFIEARFLDPNGDHTSRYALVKSDRILDRLNVRTHASTDAWVEAKLCAGTRVRIISQTDEWAYIQVTGEQGGKSYSGCVKTEYLAMEGGEVVTDGSTRIRLTQTLHAGNDGWDYRAEWSGEALPAGTYLTVIGVEGNYDASLEYPDRLLALTDEGKMICLWNDGVVEVVKSAGISARTDTSLKMRQSPDKEAAVLRTLSKGTKVEVLLRGEGCTLICYKDQIGYVMSRYLIFP